MGKGLRGHLFISILVGAIFKISSAMALVTTTQGPIEGLNGRYDTEAFLGVPYAAPPIGDLRWRAPKAPASFNGIFHAKKVSHICPQLGNMFANVEPEDFGQVVGNEDCLYLNLWRPKEPSKKLRPVVFWIHGGSNTKGTALDPSYDGAFMAKHDDVVFVSANYRLGVFGAFVHPALETGNKADDSGNYVTLDLIAVLKWIRYNAESFGGDPHNVTIAGQSAGCMNVWGLLQSPLAEHLFHKAICSAGLPNAYPSKIVEMRSNDLLKELLVADGTVKSKDEAQDFIDAQSNAAMGRYLRSKSPAEILAIKRFIIPTQHVQDGYVIPWAGLAGVSVGNYNRVPMILGNTDDEGTYLVGSQFLRISDRELYELINTPNADFTRRDIIKADYVSKFDTLTRAGSESINGMAFTIAKYLSVYQDKVYRYNFQWRNTPQPWQDIFGAIHGMDAMFYLGNFVTGQKTYARFAWTPENRTDRQRLRSQMTRYFKGFFHETDPNVYRTEEDPEWKSNSGIMIFK